MKDNLLVRIYRLLLILYPADFRQRLGEEMVTVFSEAVDEARQQGPTALAGTVLRELLQFPGSLLHAYAQSWRALEPVAVAAPSWPWLAGWTLLSVGLFPLAWFLSAPFGFLAVRLLEMLPGPAPTPAVGTATGILMAIGLVTALAQWLLLRPHLDGAGWWVPLTVAGWLLVGPLFLIASGALGSFFFELRVGIPFMVIGGCVGAAQWLLLRRVLPGGRWWLPVSLLAASTLLLAGETFESIAELVALLALPYLLTGAFLWLLLQQASRQPAGEAPRERQPGASAPRPSRARLLLVSLLLLGTLVVAGPWAYAVSQLELAKRDGIYASPEEGVQAWAEAVPGVQVERIQMRFGELNSDDSTSRVRFVGANVIFDGPHPVTGRNRTAYGTYYIRVEEGWVQVGEGAFPPLIGRLMEIYHLEGA